MGSSVVALKYESFSSPFNPISARPSQKKKLSNFTKNENKGSEKTEEECKGPITFLPLASPHLAGNYLKFQKVFKKIKEEEEEELHNSLKSGKTEKTENLEEKKEKISEKCEKNEKFNEKIEKNNNGIEGSKKRIFEEFLVIGLEKSEFVAAQVKINDGFFPAKILYEFDGSEGAKVDWYGVFCDFSVFLKFSIFSVFSKKLHFSGFSQIFDFSHFSYFFQFS